MKWRIKHSMTMFRPSKWAGRYVKLFGDKNQGFILEADTPKLAEKMLREDYNLNVNYLHIYPEE